MQYCSLQWQPTTSRHIFLKAEPQSELTFAKILLEFWERNLTELSIDNFPSAVIDGDLSANVLDRYPLQIGDFFLQHPLAG